MSLQMVISGIGMGLGARRVTNDDLAALVDSSDEWIRRRTGIGSRFFVDEGQSNTDMALVASREALEQAGRSPKELDALIFATLSPDYAFPGTGVLLQDALGAAPIPALDVRNQCSGFLYGLSVADGWLRAGIHKRVLLVGSEIHSTGLNLTPQGRDVAVLFGDGAGAVVLEAVDVEQGASDERMRGRVVDISLGADGSQAELLMCERPGSQFHPRLSADDIAAGRHFPKMDGRKVFRRAVEVLSREVQAAMERTGSDPAKVVLVPHQSNKRINELVASRLGVDEQRVVHTIEEWGNTTAASVPMALHRALTSQMIKAGDTAVFAAFGSGLTWGTAVVKF